MEREKAMSEGAYELLALAARYWFVLLIALIVARGWHACVTDNRRGKLLRRADFSAPRTQDGRFILCDGDNLEIGPLTMTLVLYDAQEIAEPEEPQSPPPPAPKPRARRGENGVIEYDDEFWG